MDSEFQGLLDAVRAYHPNVRAELLLDAYRFMMELHQGQVRRSGEPYHVHPIAVAHLAIQLRLDEEAIAAALLHDVVEDSGVGLPDLVKRFGPDVAALVDGVTKLEKIHFQSKEERQAETLRKMIVATARDVRVLLIKLCDRTHNMRTLRHMSRDRQKAIAAETLEIYAPLANRLGIHWIKAELEDGSLKYLKPEVYQDLKAKVSEKRAERDRITRKYRTQLEEKLKERGIRAEVLGRSKHFYSIYAKMVRQGIPFEHVYDLLGLRIIVDSIDDCYQVLGLIHSIWVPVQGRFKDYIRATKPNGYQSLHTAVVTEGGLNLETQIRTREMHEFAENGIAAHWKYKEGRVMRPREIEKVEGLKQLLELGSEASGSREFLSAVKMDLYDDTVFVQTPQGDLRALPRGASPVDFAFSVHSEVGFHCTGARVNGKMVPLDHALNDGDVIEILTHPAQHPSRDWLKFLKSPRARLKVRNYVKKTQTETAARIGEGKLEKELERFEVSYNRAQKKGELVQAARKLGYDTLEALLVQIGNGKVDSEAVAREIVPPEEFDKFKHPNRKVEPLSITGVFKRMEKKTHSSIMLDEMKELAIQYARCCKPLHGDEVVGFMSRGRGMIVHLKACANALALMEAEPERIVEVSWNKEVHQQLPVTLDIVIDKDRSGLLADITKALADEGLNLTRVNFGLEIDHKGEKRLEHTIEMLVDSVDKFRSVIKKLKKIKNITDVHRKTT
jgi:GTP pyrophosphokinase